jgi:hypothetical protein
MVSVLEPVVCLAGGLLSPRKRFDPGLAVEPYGITYHVYF